MVEVKNAVSNDIQNSLLPTPPDEILLQAGLKSGNEANTSNTTVGKSVDWHILYKYMQVAAFELMSTLSGYTSR